MARKGRREMSGIFDIFRRKKTEERELALPKPPRPGLLDIFRPKSQLPAAPSPTALPAPPAPRRLPRMFEAIAPAPIEPPPGPPALPEPAARPPVIWEALYGPPAEEEPPVAAMFQPLPEITLPPVPVRPPAPPEAPKETRYTFIRIPHLQEIGAWRFPTVAEMATHLRSHFTGIDRMFEDLRALRASPDFRKTVAVSSLEGRPVMVRVDPVALRNLYTDFAALFNVPWNVVDAYFSGVRTQEEKEAADAALMGNLFEPLMRLLTQAFETMKPADLPGFFLVDFDDETNNWWLFYVETAAGPSAPGLPYAGGPGA